MARDPRAYQLAARIIATALFVAAASAQAGDWLSELRLGVLDHATELTSSGREEGIDLNLEAVFRKLPLWGEPRPYIGISGNIDKDTDHLYGGLVWQWQPGQFFLTFGLGAAVHNGELLRRNNHERSLGSRGLFHSAAEAGWQISRHYDIALYYQHISNGPLHGKRGANDGLDNVGLRLGYSFQ